MDSNQDDTLTSEKQIKILCGQEYIIPLSVAQTSMLFKNIIDDCSQQDDSDMEIIPLPEYQVSPYIMPQVIEYMKYIVDIGDEILTEIRQKNEPTFTDFEIKYFQNITNDQLFNITKASNYLDIPHLMDICCLKISNTIKQCNAPEEIRKAFIIHQDNVE
tara:strand:- start:12 stop:491 length:480 start_codon:yes stop_codon:yes gene_type:complete